MSFGNWLWPLRRRQLFSAASANLKIMASAVLFERHPLERTVRWRTVANELSTTFVTGMRFLGANVRLRCSTSWRMVRPSGQRHREHEVRAKYWLPRLDMPPNRFLPPVEFCRGTRPSGHRHKCLDRDRHLRFQHVGHDDTTRDLLFVDP